MKPHKHAELIKAWADGAGIECRDSGVWYHAKDPRWQEDIEYRIKPQAKPDEDWICILWDGEREKIKINSKGDIMLPEYQAIKHFSI